MRMEFSAGGIVFKKEDNKTLILLAKPSGRDAWVFPKGLIGDHVEGEKKEDTAVREVKEEAGIEAKIIKPLTPITYWFVFKGKKTKKTVYYFVMEYLGGDMNDRDNEMEEVGWVAQSEVLEKLTYPSDKQVWQEAKKLIE